MQIATQEKRQSESTVGVKTDQRVVLKYFDVYYTVDGDEPIIHIIARDEQKNPWHVEVEGFTPYFCVPKAEKSMDEWEQLYQSDHRITDINLEDSTSMSGDVLTRIEVDKPWEIKDLRENFDNPLEADVSFADRFLIDMGIKQCFSVPTEADSRLIKPDEIESVDVEDPRAIDVEPRIVTFDIEVKQGNGDGPSVVSDRGTELAMQPITAIAAHDNYSDSYRVWILENDSWSTEDCKRAMTVTEANTCVYEDEYTLLSNFCSWVADRRFDIITGWNCTGFDVPYIVNRCLKEKDVTSIFGWSPTNDVETMDGEGKWINSDLKGMIIFDMIMGVKKTQVTELDSYRLDDVAHAELGTEKVNVGDIDDSWKDQPELFTEYVKRDTELVVEINRSRNILVESEDDDNE